MLRLATRRSRFLTVRHDGLKESETPARTARSASSSATSFKPNAANTTVRVETNVTLGISNVISGAGGLTKTQAGMLKESLSPEDWGRLTAYVERVQAGQATSPEEDRLVSQIAKGAVLKLTETNRVRLQALSEKAVVAAARP